MPEALKIILTSALTVFGGVLVLVMGQLIIKFIVEPLHEQAKLIGEIASSLVFYGNAGTKMAEYYAQQEQMVLAQEGIEDTKKQKIAAFYAELSEKQLARADEASNTLRKQASELMGATQAIRFYKLWVYLFKLPDYQEVIEASSNLIGLSNSDSKSDSSRVRTIAKCLHIEIMAERFGRD